MHSPSLKTTRKVDTECKYYLLYFMISFLVLIICRPSFILKKEHIDEEPTKLSYSKLLLWQLIFCFPLILDYIINN